ncbi:AzlC family ABC transporter permease [Comamonas badia]|uniref:AzlC family ABC transporter permease n=1 Tax=Comamonas badia TaxID=265291 RepID=UPI0004043B2E|nr:AzlC family ABC transporter permease [Comamonas badia]
MTSAMTALRQVVRSPHFRLGMTDMTGLALGIAAWGLVTGVAMVKAGMGVGMAIVLSLTVFAGSAQLAVLPLMAANAPLWVIWLTATCVNLRFVIFSDLWRTYFAHLPRWHRVTIGYLSGDVIFVGFLQRFPKPEPQAQQVPYFWGAATVLWLAWQVASIIGIVAANEIPLEWGLGFAGVLALLGILMAMLTDTPSWLATITACTAAIAAYALPLKLNILLAVVVAVAVGLAAESLEQARKRARATRSPGGPP